MYTRIDMLLRKIKPFLPPNLFTSMNFETIFIARNMVQYILQRILYWRADMGEISFFQRRGGEEKVLHMETFFEL